MGMNSNNLQGKLDTGIAGRYKPYPAYKDSSVEWIGKIPAEWEVRRLKTIASIHLSNVDKKSMEGQISVKLCNYTDVYYHEKITGDLEFMSATATANQIRRFSLRKNDVLITKDSESWTDIAVSSVIEEDLPDVVCGYHLAHIRPNEFSYGPFLSYSFNAIGPRDQFQIAANGITRYGLGGDAISSGLFIVPPIPEQMLIVGFLDRETARIDALVKKKERLIEFLQEKRTALISHAVTKGLNPNAPMKDSGVEWLGEIPAHWEVKKLKYAVKFQGGGTPEKANLEYWVGEIPWVSPKDMKESIIIDTEDKITLEAIAQSATKIIPSGSVLLVVRSGILIHTIPVAIAGKDMALNQDLKALITNAELLPQFLYYLISGMQKELLSEWKKEGATVESLEMELITGTVIPIPSIDEQREIISFIQNGIKKIDDLLGTIDKVISHLKEYRTALISATVTGKIDVRGEIS